eukprot:gene10219-8136_t
MQATSLSQMLPASQALENLRRYDIEPFFFLPVATSLSQMLPASQALQNLLRYGIKFLFSMLVVRSSDASCPLSLSLPPAHAGDVLISAATSKPSTAKHEPLWHRAFDSHAGCQAASLSQMLPASQALQNLRRYGIKFLFPMLVVRSSDSLCPFPVSHPPAHAGDVHISAATSKSSTTNLSISQLLPASQALKNLRRYGLEHVLATSLSQMLPASQALQNLRRYGIEHATSLSQMLPASQALQNLRRYGIEHVLLMAKDKTACSKISQHLRTYGCAWDSFALPAPEGYDPELHDRTTRLWHSR